MKLAIYPLSLTAPVLSAYALKQEVNLLRPKMNSGHVEARRRFKSAPTFMSLSWSMKKDEAILFEDFISNELNEGSSWFLMDILTPLGMIEHHVRFVTSPLEDYKLVSSTVWSYTAQAEIKKRVIIDKDITALILSVNYSPDLWAGILASLSLMVNKNALST